VIQSGIGSNPRTKSGCGCASVVACSGCGHRRGAVGDAYQSTQVSETRNVLLTHRHYLETIERVLKSEREADPRIKLGYIATAIERWRQDPFATGE
jgi:hypothetical protein